MCICREPDVRSNYELLQTHVTPEYRNIQDQNDGSRDNNENANQSYLASEEYSPSSYNIDVGDDAEWKISKWELRIRIAMMIILTFISVTMYQKQKEVGLQREMLRSSIQEIGKVHRDIQGRRFNMITKENRQEFLNTNEKFTFFEVDVDTRIDRLL